MAYPVKKFEKDPDARLDYSVDWASFLGTDTIAAVTWIIAAVTDEDPVSLEKDDEDFNDTVAVIIVKGGTLGNRYLIVCRVTTASGLIDDRTIQITIKQK